MKRFLPIKKDIIFLLIILAIGALLRFYGLNWDQNQHLHPDERFLTMVGNAMKMPESIFAYLDPTISTFNPENIGFSFFVYGVAPLTMNKLLALVFSTDTYNAFTIQGRFLSGFLDLLVVLFIFKAMLLFEKQYKWHTSIKYFASFLYAIAVLPIQLSHFFANDTFLNFFLFVSFYFSLRFLFLNKTRDVLLSALFFGLAFSTKVSAIYMLPLLGIIFILPCRTMPIRLLLLGLLFVVTSYLTVRIADPYMFANENIFDPHINTHFWENLKSLKSFEGEDIWYPPAIQWISKPPVLFSLSNLAIFGLGIPYFIVMVFGWGAVLAKKKLVFWIISLWILSFFLYQSTQFVKVMRYFIFLYPFFAIFAGVGLYEIVSFTKKHFAHWPRLAGLVCICSIGSILVWPLSFFSIYTKDHSRVTASNWIYEHIPNGSILLGEHWDDALPIGSIPNTSGKQFTIELLPVFDPDTQEKWDEMTTLLQRADYYIPSSNRAWGSISSVPSKYPQMSTFYIDLFNEKVGFAKVQEFSSYPPLRYLGIPIDFPDYFSDESFTVYDHPKVIIFKKHETSP